MRSWLVGSLLLGLTTASWAEPTTTTPTPKGERAIDKAIGTTRLVVPYNPSKKPASQISTTLYMNRCKGGCMLMGGAEDDARQNVSHIPAGNADNKYPMTEFKNSFGDTGANGHCAVEGTACTLDSQCPASSCLTADKEWNALVQCMKEVYSPYNVKIVDSLPTDGSSYHMAIVAGLPQEIGITTPGVLGIAPLLGDCSPLDNVISFSFANAHSANDRVNNLCWTVSQESAHAFGLDHEYSFIVGNRSACNDPMTYRQDCGGQKYFRNEQAKCGTDAPGDCGFMGNCGMTQNSHQKILTVFGPGQSIIPPPTSEIIFPLTGATIQNGVQVNVKSYSKRGVARLELYINGRKWSEVPGGAFGPSGQPEKTYQLTIPSKVPDSVMDIFVRSYDDLNLSTDSATQTITKNHACTDDASCELPGMTCSGDGKCAWPPASGELGAACTYNEFCLSNMCVDTSEGGVCSQECFPGVKDQCDTGFTCEPTGNNKGVCLATAEEAGCCSVGDSPNAALVHGGLGLAVLGFVARRRSKRTKAAA